ncbi:MAG TPA: radical SAM protein [Candidatus Eisenbacteria bacterium]|nr:radical SAM protein [Candidatus Eisenbacteria bacterium]
MRITLLHPATGSHLQTHRSGNGHLGLGYIAAVLLQKQHEVRILDAKNSLVNDDVLRRHVSDFTPQLFGVTAMTHEVHAAAHACSVVKSASPATWTVVGGPHATALPERTLEEFPSVDITVAGEGELTMTELADAHRQGRPLEQLGDIAGIAFRDGSRVVRNRARPWIDNLDNMPFPAWELFPKVWWPVMASRGCPFGCVFCQRVLGRRVRMRSVENVLAEFDALEERLGQRDTWFQDETFGINKRWADEFLGKLSARNQRRGYVWTWGGNSRANLANVETYRRMKASGCNSVSFGVESGDEEILKRICKGITPRMAIDAVAAAQKAGLKAATFFILGHPGETWRTALKTVHLAARCRANSIAVGVMVPYPGTEVWRMAQAGEFGYQLLTEDWRMYDKYFGNALAVKGLSHRQLEFLQSLAYLWYYIYNRKFRELLRFAGKFRHEAWAMLKRLLVPVRPQPEPAELPPPRPKVQRAIRKAS